MSHYAVDRCICHDVTFQELAALRRQTGASLEQMTEATGCSSSCGMCRPYILAMLATGQTRFGVIAEPLAQMLENWYRDGGGPWPPK